MSVEQHEQKVEEQKPGTTEVSIEDLLARIEQLESSKERVLAESKEFKAKYKTLKEDLTTQEKERLEKEEKWQELLELEKNNLHQTKQELVAIKKKAIKKALDFEVARYAKDAVDVKDVLHNIPTDIIEFDEDQMEFKGVQDAVSLVREKKPYLFQTTKTSGMVDGRPAAQKPVDTPITDLSSDERMNLLKQAMMS